MAHLHLQLLAARFNDLADDYLRRVGWLAEPAVASVQMLQRSIDDMGGLRCFQSLRALLFDDVQLAKEILHFDRPVVCCKRVLRCTDTLIAHFLSDSHADGALEDETKRTAILFNLYVQVFAHVLVRYCKQYEQVDQFTMDYLRKGRDYLTCILRNPIRGDAAVVGTYVRTNFWKWKYVFDYACGHCSLEGYEECEFAGAIAWFKIFGNSLKINPIRHVESKMHLNTVHNLRPDQIIPTKEEINNNKKWKHPKAAVFLHHVRHGDLYKLEEIACVVANAKLVKYLFGLQPTARPMYFLLKKWKQNFHTHVLVMLLVFYMQRQNYLPPIRAILNGPQKLKNNSFNTNFCTNFEATIFPGHLPMLARGFFEFYKKFDWTANGTCAFDGEIKPKSAFQIAGGRKSVPPMLCSDFFDQSRNIAANIAKPDYERFVVACAEASEILEARRSFS